MNSPRVLIINPFGIGDVLFSTPLIGAVRGQYPHSFIGYICNRRAREVLCNNPALDAIFVYEKDDYRDLWKVSRLRCIGRVAGFLAQIRKGRFDIAIDLSLGYQYSLILKLVGVRKRIGFNFHSRGKFLTDKVDISGFADKHVIEYYLDLLKPLGIMARGRCNGPRMYLSEEHNAGAGRFLAENGIAPNDMLVGLIPGCGASWGLDAKYRRWGRENFAAVADTLIGKHRVKIILFGDAKEEGLCREVRSLMKHEPVIACGRTSIGMFLSLASRCALIVTNDGGPLHMSVSLGVKTVSIFGPVDEKVYGPYPPSERHITVTADVPCRPCYRNFKYVKCDSNRCLKEIRPEEVLAAAEKLLSGSVRCAAT